ncbi:MAG: two-component system sensor histidine kinase RegB [Rhodocyclaceae bacterium]|nr:MAG: two-component system sensor histidine kinase RegB [Rhodocyclaceae bacterium]TND02841.1 MAG: two-component system, sensor histidine kinase RegB [Rhodocyclaceae bacterium]
MANFTTPEDGSNLRLNLRRTVTLRWWLLAAVAIAVSSAPTLLDIALPQLPMFAVVVLMVAFNGYVQWRTGTDEPVGAAELFGQLCVDLAALGILLYLSGGAANPLISFLLVPVAVAALSLPGRLTAAVALLAVAIYSLLMWQFLPLPVADAERATRLHLAGMWLTFVVSAAMIAWFVARMTASIRERDTRLAAAREQALRDERVVALGALAAGAAHELGTPLATIAVIVGELEREVGLDAEARRDLSVVMEQIELCKGIISTLAERTGTRRPEHVEVVDARVWLEALRARWHAMRPQAASRLTIAGGPGVPLIVTEATLEQALINLLNNAADAGDAEIEVRLAWDRATLTILIADGGPGFPAEVLHQAGRVPLPARDGGAGIGLLLAYSAIERLGGRIALDNPTGGGGRVRIELPIAQDRTTTGAT